MEGNNTSLGLETVLRIRVPEELKTALADAAKKRRKRPSQFVRDILWNVVDSEAQMQNMRGAAKPAPALEDVATS